MLLTSMCKCNLLFLISARGSPDYYDVVDSPIDLLKIQVGYKNCCSVFFFSLAYSKQCPVVLHLL